MKRILRFKQTTEVMSEKETLEEAIQDAYAQIGDGWDFEGVLDWEYVVSTRSSENERKQGHCFHCKRPVDEIPICGCT